MSNVNCMITVAGDVCIDWMQYPVKQKNEGLNWELYPGTAMIAKTGGVLLLAEFLRRATKVIVLSPEIKNVESVPPTQILHSNAELDLFPYSNDPKEKNNPVYRVKRFLGFSGPSTGNFGLLSIENDRADAEIIVVDDAGNGFREKLQYWPKAITEKTKKPTIIYKMSCPIAKGKLWEHTFRNHADRMIVIINADDLRANGVNISRCLSWERTALDFVWQMASNPNLLQLANCTNIVVRFGSEGAIHYTRKNNKVESHLYFDPFNVEDGYAAMYPGEMQGLSAAFVAAFTAKIADSKNKDKTSSDLIQEATRSGILCVRRFFKNGFGNNAGQPDLPGVEVFTRDDLSDNIADIIIPNPIVAEPADPNFWCMLKELKGAQLEEIAYDIVRTGENKASMQIPAGQFRNLKTVDRAEIESFRSISNLIQEYINSKSSSRPLSIAVFGSPGSGKSFAVTEVAESVAPGQVARIDFNVSQFKATTDLISAFHRVRDIALSGKIPLVFFDEFDSYFEGKLGWLKHFLAPMQDGVFREGETLHPIGKAIFVFAGGIYSNFAAFSSDKPNMKEDNTDDFRNAKGPDFVSRLRGYVNILGPNPIDDNDTVFMIRRAMLLRSLLERKTKQLLNGKNQIRIDKGVLRALIKVPNYRHGARSMEAIIEMSMLSEQKCWEQAFLPPKEQLKLHVDEEMFSRLVVRDVLLGAAREVLAKAIHEEHLKDQEGKRSTSDLSMRPWETLDENLKESNRRQADHIPEKLSKVGYGFAPVVGREPIIAEFTKQETENMAELEHERWVSERQTDGWTYNKERIPEKKLTPYLVPWNELTDEVKEWDRRTVKSMPTLLAKAKFEIYKMH